MRGVKLFSGATNAERVCAEIMPKTRGQTVRVETRRRDRPVMTPRYPPNRINQRGGKIMELKPGDVVVLKSGGLPVTVTEVNEDTVECVWMGNDGDLFRETLPLAVLEPAETDDPDEDEDEEGEDEDDEEHKKSKVA
jgi:uncharacterized protein YodC (DUF2158 family)